MSGCALPEGVVGLLGDPPPPLQAANSKHSTAAITAANLGFEDRRFASTVKHPMPLPVSFSVTGDGAVRGRT